MAGVAKTLLSPITSIIGGVGGALGLGGKGNSNRLEAPTPDDRLSRANRERQAVNRYGSAGRVSTLLDDGKLG